MMGLKVVWCIVELYVENVYCDYFELYGLLV